MLVYSIKSSTLKFCAVTLICVLVLVSLLALIPTYSDSESASAQKTVYSDIESDDDRIKFIANFGWEVEREPVDVANVTIPAEFDRVFTGYNAIQKEQGLDLDRYKNKKVTRYTYKITNYPEYEGEVYFNMLVYKNRVIGGDVCSAANDGFVHGFEKSRSHN